jgi:hypothetical protein
MATADVSSGASAGNDDVQPEGWMDRVFFERDAEGVRVTLDSRDGNQVFVRQLDPCDDQDPPRVPLYPGDQVIVMTPIHSLGHNLTSEVGRVDDFLFGQRLVEVRREPGRVIARTMLRGEPDDGRRIHVRPGDQLTFEEGGIVAQLDTIDDMERGDATGYSPVTPALWTWFRLGLGHDDAKMRYVLAAARRLDAAARLVAQLEDLRAQLNRTDLAGPQWRRNLHQLVGTVELAVVALGRAVDMASQATDLIHTAVPLPPSVTGKAKSVRMIRNAYEHIEDRALGQVNGKPHPKALTIFDHETLLVDDVIDYDGHRLSLVDDVPVLLAELRQFLKDVAGTA